MTTVVIQLSPNTHCYVEYELLDCSLDLVGRAKPYCTFRQPRLPECRALNLRLIDSIPWHSPQNRGAILTIETRLSRLQEAERVIRCGRGASSAATGLGSTVLP